MLKSKNKRLIEFVFVFAIALLVILAVIAAGLLVQKNQLEKERAELEEHIEFLKAERAAGKDILQDMYNYEWVEKKAIALGLIKEGQKLWILLGGE